MGELAACDFNKLSHMLSDLYRIYASTSCPMSKIETLNLIYFWLQWSASGTSLFKVNPRCSAVQKSLPAL